MTPPPEALLLTAAGTIQVVRAAITDIQLYLATDQLGATDIGPDLIAWRDLRVRNGDIVLTSRADKVGEPGRLSGLGLFTLKRVYLDLLRIYTPLKSSQN